MFHIVCLLDAHTENIIWTYGINREIALLGIFSEYNFFNKQSFINMKIKKKYTSLASATVAILSACTHTPSPQDIPAGSSFTTNILPDDTKLFNYTIGRAEKSRDNPREDESSPTDDSDQRSRTGGKGRGSHDGGKSHNSPSTQDVQKGVVAVLAQNHYCREGYVVLEQYQAKTGYIVRGECRDAADSADKAKFIH